MRGACFCEEFGNCNVAGALSGEFGGYVFDRVGCMGGSSTVDSCCDLEAFAILRLLDLDF